MTKKVNYSFPAEEIRKELEKKRQMPGYKVENIIDMNKIEPLTKAEKERREKLLAELEK